VTGTAGKESDKALTTLALSLRSLGGSVASLPSAALIDPHLRQLATLEAQRLAREHAALQSAIGRYMDSRDAAGDDGANEWVLPGDPMDTDPVARLAAAGRAEETTMSAQEQIKQTVEKNDVVLFMKGTKMMPQCGFSSRVAGVLNFMGVEFQDVNVLADPDIRQGIKDFSDWPTIPQLYVKGEFVGGCDIVTEMTLSGELDQLLEAKGVAFDKAAADKIREANA
jgi:monothiol glutaredoxin